MRLGSDLIEGVPLEEADQAKSSGVLFEGSHSRIMVFQTHLDQSLKNRFRRTIP